jgi:hypothetical protein
VKGIEPSYAAWEAAVLPLNYTRMRSFDGRFWMIDLQGTNWSDPFRHLLWKGTGIAIRVILQAKIFVDLEKTLLVSGALQ